MCIWFVKQTSHDSDRGKLVLEKCFGVARCKSFLLCAHKYFTFISSDRLIG